MPRKAKTLSGAPAQAIKAPRGGPYGEGERALESQRRAPLPDVAAQSRAPAPTRAPQGANAGATNPMAAALAAATGMQPPDSVLTTPTSRPEEPLMAAVRGGRQVRTPAVNEALYELRALAQRNPQYADLIAFLGDIERLQA